MAGGRPVSVDMNDPETRKQVELFGSLVATHVEMANWFECTVRTIENYMEDHDSEFFRVYKRAEAESKQSLRRLQMNAAQDGNPTILVWLGKQLLGQKDKIETDNKHSGDMNLLLVPSRLKDSTLEDIMNASNSDE